MASHFTRHPADTGTDDPRIVSILSGREWLDPVDLRVRQLHYKPHGNWDRTVAWWCIIIATVTFWYFIAQLVRGWLS